MFKKHYFSHAVRSCSTSIQPLSDCSVLVPVTLRAPSQNAQSAVIGQLSVFVSTAMQGAWLRVVSGWL